MVDNIDNNDLHFESSEITGPEGMYWFNYTIERLDKFWTIKEVKMERTWELNHNTAQKKFSFRIDDASKTLTVDQIKKIMHDEYGYHEAALSVNIIGKNNTKWSTICTNNDVIHIIVDVNRNKELKAQSSQQIDTTVYENNSGKEADERDIKQESPYKEMIENQTAPITHWNRKNPDISLTFDDWYWEENIKYVLEKLKGSWIHATFFILWECLKKTPDLWRKAVEEWHQICCHTYSHIYLSGWEYTDLWDKQKWISAWPWKLNKTDLNNRSNNVKSLLWEKDYNTLKAASWDNFPRKVKSDLLLKTEILMWEAQVEKTLWKGYLQNFKYQHPFFRFPGWCWATSARNIDILKGLWYLSIWWSEDFYRWTWKNRKHMSLDDVRNMNIANWEILVNHFKKEYEKWQPTEREYISAYIDNMVNKGKVSKPLTETIK